MVDWRISSDENGNLHILHTVVRGPEPIADYDCKNSPCSRHCKDCNDK